MKFCFTKLISKVKLYFMIIKNREIPFWTILLSVYVLFVLLHIVLSSGMSTPTVFADELGPWLKARFMATGEGANYPNFMALSHPGYSLLLAPILYFVKDVGLAYKTALILNAFISSIIPVLTLVLAKKLSGDKNTILIISISILVGLYPAHMLYANLLMSEVVLTPVYLLISLLAYRTLEKQNNKLWGSLGFLSGIAFIFHPRLLIISIASIALSILWKDEKNKRNWLLQVISTILGTAIGLFAANYSMTLITVPKKLISGEFDSYIMPLSNIEMIIKTLYSTFLNSFGQIFYLIASTYGLFVIGISMGIFSIYQIIIKKDKKISTGIAAFFVIIIILSIAISSFTSNVTLTRFDRIIYGRYNEAFLAPLLIISLLHLYKIRSRNIYIFWTIGILASILISFIIPHLLYSPHILPTLASNPINIFGVIPIIFRLTTLSLTPILMFSTTAIVIVMTSWMINKKKYVIPITLISLLFLIFSFTTANFFLKPYSRSALSELDVLPVLREIYNTSADKKIGIDSSVANKQNSLVLICHYNFYIPFEFDLLADNSQFIPDIIISNKIGQNIYAGARIINISPSIPFYFYVMPGKTQEILDKKKLLLPAKQIPIGGLDKENFYFDNFWTNGNGLLKNIDYNIKSEDKTLILHTKGRRPDTAGKMHLKIFVNNMELEAKKVINNSYYFKIDKSIKTIDQIEIISNTFIPKSLGLNEDQRILGIDVDSIEFSAQ